MIANFRFPRPSKRQSGIALVMVLLILVLITGLLVAFFSRATNTRQVTAIDAAGARAEILAHGAVDLLTADFVQEMMAGSGTAVGHVFRVDVSQAPNMIPQRAVKPALVAPTWDGTVWTNSETLNLIKQSASGVPFFKNDAAHSYTTPGPSRASAVSTSGTGPGGRSIPPGSWLKPRLLTSGTFTPDQTPDWVYLSRDGSTPSTYTAALKNRSDDSKFVVGRFAYQVYDVGGLLDLNAAGFDPTVKSGTLETAKGRKGALLFADLSAIPGFDALTPVQIQSIVNWRNKEADWENGSPALLAYGGSNGWLRPKPTASGTDNDNMFLGRSDLIHFLEATTGTTAARAALPYLTAFSREADRPSSQPDLVRPKVQFDQTEGGSLGTKDNDDAYNPGAHFITQSAGGTPDGSLLVKHRFALENLALLKSTGTANDAQIYDLFGLKRSP